jgi:hypothetical protein
MFIDSCLLTSASSTFDMLTICCATSDDAVLLEFYFFVLIPRRSPKGLQFLTPQFSGSYITTSVVGGQRERLLFSGLFIRAKSELIEGIHAAGVHSSQHLPPLIQLFSPSPSPSPLACQFYLSSQPCLSARYRLGRYSSPAACARTRQVNGDGDNSTHNQGVERPLPRASLPVPFLPLDSVLLPGIVDTRYVGVRAADRLLLIACCWP